MKKNILFVLLSIFIIQGCGSSVSRDSDDNTHDVDIAPSIDYKQTRHKEDWVKNINIKGFTSDSIRDENGNFYFVSTDSPDFRVTKLNSDTDIVWTKKIETQKENYMGSITLDNQGNIYLSGESSDSFISKQKDIVAMKLSNDGELLWSSIRKNTKSALIYKSETDSQGNLYLVGSISTTDANHVYDAIIIKYSTDGEKEWEKTINTKYYTNAHSIVIDKEDNIYISGVIGRNIFFAEYDTNGKQILYKEFKNSNDQRDTHMSLGNDGYLYIGGVEIQKDKNGAYLEENTNKLFIQKLNKNGDEKLYTLFDSSVDDNEYIHAITSDIYGNIYTYGEYYMPNKTDGGGNIGKLFIKQFDKNGKLLYSKEYNGVANLGGLGINSNLTIDEDDSIYISDNGYLQLQGDERSLGSFILKLSPTP